MELKPERLAAQLAAEPLRPAYLVAGPETLLVLEAADAIRGRARDAGFGEREVFDADGRDFDWNALDATFRAPSLFSAQRLVELRLPTGKPGKEGSEVIADYCANPPGDIVLRFGMPPEGHRYVRVAADILLIAVGTGMVVDALEDLNRM